MNKSYKIGIIGSPIKCKTPKETIELTRQRHKIVKAISKANLWSEYHKEFTTSPEAENHLTNHFNWIAEHLEVYKKRESS